MSKQDGLRAVIDEALRGIGLSDEPKYDSDIHSWRCRHPDKYGPCACFGEAVEHIATKVAEALKAMLPETPPPTVNRCNCVVLWNGITEQHEWLNGSFDGSCGHPATGTKAES